VRLLLGDLEATEGSLRRGTNLEVAYFDQLRGELDLTRNAIDNLSEGREFIDINGQSKHVMGYLQDFLFTPERARSPVSVFSGGERARLLLAKLFSKPANVLVLDEPTNDLDVETLELLEEQLSEFRGTVIVISHDREFLDNVVTETLFLDGTGQVHEFVGGYTDWRRQGGQFPAEKSGSRPDKQLKPESKSKSKPAAQSGTKPAAAKISYKLKLELEQLPKTIERLEQEQQQLQDAIGSADFYANSAKKVDDTLARLTAVGAELETAMERWMELEEMTGK
jgi:ATP-binding cassette subfamily F protein uup